MCCVSSARWKELRGAQGTGSKAGTAAVGCCCPPGLTTGLQPQALGLGHRDWEVIFPFYRACGAEVSWAGRVWSPCVEQVQVSPSLSSSSRRHLGRLILLHRGCPGNPEPWAAHSGLPQPCKAMDMAPPAGSARRDKEGAKGSGFTGATFREARTPWYPP